MDISGLAPRPEQLACFPSTHVVSFNDRAQLVFLLLFPLWMHQIRRLQFSFFCSPFLSSPSLSPVHWKRRSLRFWLPCLIHFHVPGRRRDYPRCRETVEAWLSVPPDVVQHGRVSVKIQQAHVNSWLMRWTTYAWPLWRSW